MITPQDIKEKTFEKALFGGYDMAAVDSFLEEISTDLALLQRENATLKGKMKVLVDKVEEYRGNEDALRMAVVSAQRLGNIIEREARDKADALVNDATAEAARITKDAQLEVEMEKARLDEAKRSSAQFVENMELLCNRQLSFLEKVGEMDFIKEHRANRIVEVVPEQADAPQAEAPVAVPYATDPGEIHETVKRIEETVAKAADEPVSDVRPNFAPAASADDEMPTRAFHIVTDPDDDVDKTTQFTFDGFEK
jgi:cell division initiation protein